MFNTKSWLVNTLTDLVAQPDTGSCLKTICKSCADPENFVMGGPTLTVFCVILVDEGREIQIPL